MDATYYCHQSEGQLIFDPGQGTKKFEPWWAIVRVEQGIVDFYCWISKRYGKPLMQNKLWGPHISFIKGEFPPNVLLWDIPRLITFNYSNTIRYDNDCHAWLDVWSDDLIQLRHDLGLPPKLKMSYHVTLGRMM
jgi:hypothetical protein